MVSKLSRLGVRYLGFVDGEEKYSVLARSWLMIYPSRYDSFPISVLESLACGTPVIAYDIPGIVLNYKYCRAVMTVKLGDTEELLHKALTIINNSDLLAQLRNDAIKFSLTYNWDLSLIHI